MKYVAITLTSLIFLLGTAHSKELSFKAKIGRKIASVYQEELGNKVFSKILECKSIEKSKTYMKESVECMSRYLEKDISDSKRIDYTVFLLAGKNFSSLAKCDFETLEKHPSIINSENEFILCSEYERGSRSKADTAIFVFERFGKELRVIRIEN